jgi:HSP20 family protein
MAEPTEVTVRRDPFDLMRRGRLLDWLAESAPRLPVDWGWGEAIPVDLSRKDNTVIVRASMPGFDANEIDLQVTDGTVSIRAEHKEETEERGEQYYRRERRSGFCSRSIELPEAVAADKVTAEFKQGVLTITAPVSERAKSSHIPIQAV